MNERKRERGMNECVHKGPKEPVQLRLHSSLKERGQMNARERREREKDRERK